jgi:hypothetical protein
MICFRSYVAARDAAARRLLQFWPAIIISRNDLPEAPIASHEKDCTQLSLGAFLKHLELLKVSPPGYNTYRFYNITFEKKHAVRLAHRLGLKLIRHNDDLFIRRRFDNNEELLAWLTARSSIEYTMKPSMDVKVSTSSNEPLKTMSLGRAAIQGSLEPFVRFELGKVILNFNYTERLPNTAKKGLILFI